MDLDQLRTFDRIVRDQSFTRAAAYLNITQATASMRIRALETLLGVPLFVRGRTVTLTDQGMTFLPFALSAPPRKGARHCAGLSAAGSPSARCAPWSRL